jgi:dolichol-phosphate mannosyltransferase
MPEPLMRIIRFGIVGCAGIAIDFAVTWIFKEIIRVNKFTANAAGFSVAVINNYLLNRAWTFKNSNPQVLQQFGWFVLISAIGLAMNTGILYFLHTKKKIPFYLAKLLAIFFVFCWNFAANTFFTFR